MIQIGVIQCFEYMCVMYDVILVNKLKGKLFLLQVVDFVVDCHILEDILLLEGIIRPDDFLLFSGKIRIGLGYHFMAFVRYVYKPCSLLP